MTFDRMRRREFITLLGGAAATWPLAARAQQRTLPVVGFLNSGWPAEWAQLVAAFNQGLTEAGYVEGRNVAIEYRWARGQNDRLPELATDLVRRRVAVIASMGGTTAALVAKAATATIPIVFVIGGDPIDDGLVTSLARPDANVTGFTVFSTLLGAKRLELLHELVPTGVLAMLVNPTTVPFERQIVQAAADQIGRQVRMLNVSTDRELDAAFATIIEQRIGGFLVQGEPFLTSRRDQLVLFTTRQAIPSVFAWRVFVTSGGLLSYGTSLPASYRQAGTYVGRILKGAKPGDLPVQQPTTFETVLNIKAAKALGLTIPTTILLRATEVIE
jgi:putative ABC transport system substrate-binding protein